MISLDYRKWIKEHQNTYYSINEISDNTIELKTDYGISTIQFTDIDESTLVEFTIISLKDESIKFYLHFELKDIDHAKQLYQEMADSLLKLKEEKTLQVLLSCSAGLTTSMFAENLNDHAKMLGLDMHFEAVPYLNIYQEATKYDVILLAPQIGYMLNRLQESLTDKQVLQIPTNAFASYDSLSVINFINDELKKYKVKDKKESVICHCQESTKSSILSLVMMPNTAQTRTYYRLYKGNAIIDSNLIIKPSFDIYDLYDIIDTILLKHSHIDLIGIAIPGIVDETEKMRYLEYQEDEVDIKNEFEKHYGIEILVSNNVNAAVMGFSLEHPEYSNILFHSQPFGYRAGGQGIMIDKKIVKGREGFSGEIKFFVERMQLSDKLDNLRWTQQGALELVCTSLLPSLCIVAPQAVAIRSPMTPDMNEIKKKLSSFIPEYYLPDFYFIKEASPYMLDGITKLCIDYLDK
ncbi:MAG: ROK family protein [Eggerthia catenaformis]|uniref:PTS sugar transporter subunit IIB n=1 Tax=Eggerthia catenaformis TaxID=31973 RepID=UPI003F9F573D